MSEEVPANPSVSGAEPNSGAADIFNLLSNDDSSSEAPKDDLGDESADSDSDETPAEDEEEEAGEETEEDEDEKVEKAEEDEEEDETVDEEIEKATGVGWKSLKKTYPDIFTKFPQLKHVIGQHQGYKEVFPTVHDAKEAGEKSYVFDVLDSQIAQGDLTAILKGFSKQDKETGNNTVQKIAERILPDLLDVDEKAFRTATKPLLTTILKNAKISSEKNQNKNLGIAADIISEFIFGTKDLADKESRRDPELEAREQRLAQREQGLASQEYDKHANALQETAYKRIHKEVLSRIDPEGVLSEFDRDAKVEKVINELTYQLQSDPTHMRIMNGLIDRVKRSRYSEEEKARFLGTYLARAKPVLSPILRKASTAASGKPGNGKPLVRNDGRKVIPSTSKSAPSFKNGKLPPTSELRRSGVSVLDILNKTAND